MKNQLVIAIALVTLNLSAQERTKENNKGDITDSMEIRQSRTPEEIAQLRMKKMTLKLDLNAEQQTEVEKLLLAQVMENRIKKNAIKEKKASTDAKLTKEELLKMQTERLDKKIALKQKLKIILNEDQYVKFEKNQEIRDRRKNHLNKKPLDKERHKE